MVRFSCFQAHIHFHKPKKTVRLSGELMEKTSDDSSVNRNLGSVSCSPTEIKSCSKEDRDSPNTADHMTDSSPTERECISEEIESKRSIDCNFLAHNSIPIRKSRSLGSGLNWVERSSGADDSDGEKEHKLSSDESADRSAVVTPDEINNCGYQLQESVLSDSIRVNSNFAKDTSIFSIGDPQQSEGEHAHQDDLCLSDGFKSDDRTLCIHPIIVKSRSLPTMTSPYRCSASFLQCSRSVEDLHGLECKTNNMLRELGRQVRYPEKDDSVVDNDKVHKENPADEASETYKYVQSAKDWIMPVLDVVTEEKGFKGETSLYPPDELPPKDFRLKRIEDWVNDLQHNTPLDESGEYAPFDDTEPSTGKFLLEDLTVMKSEVKVDPGTEAAKKYVSSLNASAASAQLTNLGLVTIPILSAFVSLKALNLSGNAIVRITAGALPRGLHTLNLSKNSISTIEGLRDLTRLRVLDLSYNRIVRIGHGLSSCSSLKELYLAGNKISEVEGLHRLLKLNILDLRFNKISTTKCLGQLAANYNCLQALSLEGNPSQKNVGEEQLRKYVISLLPHLTYYNRKPIKTGTIIKDSSDRSARLGIGTHQVDRGLELKKGKRGNGTTSQKPSRSKHGPRLPVPSGTRMSGAQGHDQLAAADFGSKMLSLRNDLSIPRSQSDGNLRAF